MSNPATIQLGMKTKIVLLIGTLITILMAAVSIVILFEWRSLMVESSIESSQNVTKAFSINVLDMLIYAESRTFFLEEQLESQIKDFRQKVDGIKYIEVLNNNRRVIAHSNLSKYNQVLTDAITVKIATTNKLLTAIYDNSGYGWIIETVLPLQIASKRWGILRIGMDAEPLRNDIRELITTLLFSTLLVIIATLIVLYILIGRITGSLKNLTKLIDKIDIDKLKIEHQPKRDDEIGFVIKHFEVLQKRIVQQKEQLLIAQKQIYHAEKLASIGRLASGVAHEINNPLNGIKNCVYSILKDPNNVQQNDEYLALINEGLNHIEIIVQKLLGFAREKSKIVESVYVNDGINKVLQLIDYRLTQKNVTIIKELQSELPAINADEQLIQEVLMNLLLNAMDAIIEEGEIKIESGIQSQNQIFVIISDNGEGISSEEIEKIFDPFYTTKAEGEGTGLGLSVSLGIIEAHGGSIIVKSEPGNLSAGKAGWTSFKIILPVDEI